MLGDLKVVDFACFISYYQFPGELLMTTTLFLILCIRACIQSLWLLVIDLLDRDLEDLELLFSLRLWFGASSSRGCLEMWGCLRRSECFELLRCGQGQFHGKLALQLEIIQTELISLTAAPLQVSFLSTACFLAQGIAGLNLGNWLPFYPL